MGQHIVNMKDYTHSRQKNNYNKRATTKLANYLHLKWIANRRQLLQEILLHAGNQRQLKPINIVDSKLIN